MKFKEASEKFGVSIEQFKEIKSIADAVKTLKPLSKLEEEINAVDDIDSKNKIYCDDALVKGNILKSVMLFSDNQLKLLKELIPSTNYVLREDIVDLDKSKKIMSIKNIHEHLNFYRNREKHGFTKKDLDRTLIRLVNINCDNNDNYSISVIPLNYLESLFYSYIRHHQFVDDNDKNLKKEIINITRNSNLFFDKELHKGIYEGTMKLLRS